eukprot:TRINITY_DN24685_c0_g2_i1.p1 TRINITY_DN24685_c0_g2~~TRINITY_DN24685_c0_g2_i1.p1  ORF type:complete len:1324 (-),score=315.12 TRINITY_DN24685_c0_g2_i1:102-3914(-)
MEFNVGGFHISATTTLLVVVINILAMWLLSCYFYFCCMGQRDRPSSSRVVERERGLPGKASEAGKFSDDKSATGRISVISDDNEVEDVAAKDAKISFSYAEANEDARSSISELSEALSGHNHYKEVAAQEASARAEAERLLAEERRARAELEEKLREAVAAAQGSTKGQDAIRSAAQQMIAAEKAAKEAAEAKWLAERIAREGALRTADAHHECEAKTQRAVEKAEARLAAEREVLDGVHSELRRVKDEHESALAEKDAAERQVKEARERETEARSALEQESAALAAERVQREAAEKEAMERAVRESMEKEVVVRAAREAAEREAQAVADAKLAAAKAEQERAAREAIEREAHKHRQSNAGKSAAMVALREQAARDAAELEKRLMADREEAVRVAREQAEKEATERIAREKEEREAAERAAREQAEKEAAEKAEREAAEQAARAQAEAERVAREKADREAREQAEREAAEVAERERVEREAKEAAERAKLEAVATSLRRERDAFQLEDDEATAREDEERERREAEELAAATGNFRGEALVHLDDLTRHTQLDEAVMIETVRRRFEKDKVYTFTGQTLLSVNPFKQIEGLYSEETVKQFQSIKMLRTPHAFSVAYRAYHNLKASRSSQSILISGESGAGKTEAQKLVMRLIAQAGKKEGQISSVEEKMLSASPVLEALGNAKTVRNNNSSRFGKFVVLQFAGDEASLDRDMVLDRNNLDLAYEALNVKAVNVETYLLETVRVTLVGPGERNYHIFYQVCAAGLAQGKATDFNLLNGSTCVNIEGVDDTKEFNDVKDAMHVLGLESTMNDLVSVIRGLLHLGNVKFTSENDYTVTTEDSKRSLETAAEALGVTAEALEDTIVFEPFTVRGRATITKKMKDAPNANNARVAIIQKIYGEVFDEIVARINAIIGSGNSADTLFCGMLDIFGFESFKVNSFEQMCINYANEVLQGLYNEIVFKAEEKLYKREGLTWNPVNVPDNQASIDLLAKPGGVFSMLDDETFIPGGSDLSLCSKLINAHAKGKILFGDRRRKDVFTIKHYAGDVTYECAGFVEKNKQVFSLTTIHCLMQSSVELVQVAFQRRMEKEQAKAQAAAQSTKKKSKETISSYFKQQLVSLVNMVNKTESHFIRCIKPTPLNKPNTFDEDYVLSQLRCGGVLQAIEVSRSGYPVRINLKDCYLDYCFLGKVHASKDKTNDASKELPALMRYLDELFELTEEPKTPDGEIVKPFEVGKNLVFFKQSSHDFLQSVRMRSRNYFAFKMQRRRRERLGLA